MRHLTQRTNGAAGRFSGKRPAEFGRALVATLAVLLAAAAFNTSQALAGVVVVLTDGTRIVADRVEHHTDTGELVVHVNRPGIALSRTLSQAEVKAVEQSPSAAAAQSFEVRADSSPAPGRDAAYVPLQGGQGDSVDRLAAREWEPGACRCGTTVGRVIGVRDDPLSAYADSVRRAFPHGVPASEAEFALELMRAERARDVLSPPNGVSPPRDGDPRPMPPQGDAPPPGPVRGVAFPAGSGPAAELRIGVEPISSQGRIDWDSLRIGVEALDAQGRLVPVSGTLQVTLWGRRQRLVRSVGEDFVAEPGDAEKLGEWTRVLDPRSIDLVAVNGATSSRAEFVVSLPQPLAEHDLSLAPFGAVHVALLAPGQGVFEATRDGVPLRHLSPSRARNLIERGTPFFAGEGTSGGPTITGQLRFERPTSSGPDRRVLTVEP